MLPVKIVWIDWDIFHYFYFFTKYIALLSLIVKKGSLHILYSYLMGVDAIDQTICPEVLGMTKCCIA
jgi:hypothetical protein